MGKNNTAKNQSRAVKKSNWPVYFLLVVIIGAAYFVITELSKKPSYVVNNPYQSITVDSSQAYTESDSVLLVPRKNSYHEFLAEAEKIATQTNDREAKEIIKFINSNSKMYLPVASGVKHLEPIDVSTKLAIVMILKNEKLPGQRWPDLISKAYIGAHFDPEISTIALKEDDSLSGFMKGLHYLHEGKHARDFFLLNSDLISIPRRCLNEVKTHTFQNRLIKIMGGKIYEKALEKEVIKMKDSILSVGQKIGDYFPLDQVYNPVLDDIFGKAFSGAERGYRQLHFQLAAAFDLIDKYYTGDTVLQKALLMYTMYVNIGHMPPNQSFSKIE